MNYMKPADIKIAKINKVKKLPKEKGTVKGALLRAMDDARKEKWSKVIIFGVGETKNRLRHSAEFDFTLLGMLDSAKDMILHD